MLERVSRLKKRPLLTSVLGWVLFSGMYLLVGIITSIGTSVENAFILASPLGVIGFACWVSGFIFSLQYLTTGKDIPGSVGGLVASTIPLAFLIFVVLIAANGGV